MSVAVSGPWDGSAFQNERKDLNNIMSEYKYEYPIKMLRKTGTIKPTSSQDWASMNLNNDGLTMYSEDYKRPNGVAKSKSFKPIAKVNLNSAKMDSVSDYRHAYRGEPVERPKQVRPRSAHRDLGGSGDFCGDTEAARSYRHFNENERKSARMRVKRLGSSYGHIDPGNATRFSAFSTHQADFKNLPYERSLKIVPPDSNIRFGSDANEKDSSYRIDFAPILNATRQEPITPVVTPKPQLSYDGPTVSVHMQDYVGHKNHKRPKAFVPDRSYRPSSAQCAQDSSYTNAYKKWGYQKRTDMPWADVAKKRTTLYSNAYNEKSSSNYMQDFQNGRINAKREAIRPPTVSWSDRPAFDGQSQYKEKFTGEQSLRQPNYKPIQSYAKPSQPIDEISTAQDSYRGTYILPPKSCKPERRLNSTEGSMDSITEYRYRFN